MKCHIAESMVNRYINHTLTLEELSAFLDHIENCSSCYDELETYFIVHAAAQQLGVEEEETVMDFKTLLQQDIRKARRYIRKKRGIRILAVTGLWLLLTAVIAALIFVIWEFTHFI